MALRTHPVLVEDPVVGALIAMDNNALSVMLVSRAIDLLPIPAALVTLASGGVRVEASNTAFNLAGLGPVDRRPSLIVQIEAQIETFIRSDALRTEFRIDFGDVVDGRHYQATLARLIRNPEQRCILTLVDQTAELRTEHNLRREMLTDSLTGLPNRAGFSDRLETLIENPLTRDRYAVLVIDLDRFSRVNACLGSMAGDELLITVARRLKGALRAQDVLARTGAMNSRSS